MKELQELAVMQTFKFVANRGKANPTFFKCNVSNLMKTIMPKGYTEVAVNLDTGNIFFFEPIEPVIEI